MPHTHSTKKRRRGKKRNQEVADCGKKQYDCGGYGENINCDGAGKIDNDDDDNEEEEEKEKDDKDDDDDADDTLLPC